MSSLDVDSWELQFLRRVCVFKALTSEALPASHPLAEGVLGVGGFPLGATFMKWSCLTALHEFATTWQPKFEAPWNLSPR